MLYFGKDHYFVHGKLSFRIKKTAILYQANRCCLSGKLQFSEIIFGTQPFYKRKTAILYLENKHSISEEKRINILRKSTILYLGNHHNIYL